MFTIIVFEEICISFLWRTIEENPTPETGPKPNLSGPHTGGKFGPKPNRICPYAKVNPRPKPNHPISSLAIPLIPKTGPKPNLSGPDIEDNFGPKLNLSEVPTTLNLFHTNSP